MATFHFDFQVLDVTAAQAEAIMAGLVRRAERENYALAGGYVDLAKARPVQAELDVSGGVVTARYIPVGIEVVVRDFDLYDDEDAREDERGRYMQSILSNPEG